MGGEDPGVAFDCSGLVQAAFAAAGVALPRTAQAQFDAGFPLAPGVPLAPGDLVFFGPSVSQVDHVGIYVGTQGGSPVMVDAPHTGADVRFDAIPTQVGARWGDQRYLGAVVPL